MAVKLHRCRFEWLKTGPCWRVEKALKEMGVDYELAPGPSRPSKRDEMIEHTMTFHKCSVPVRVSDPMAFAIPW